MTHCEVCGCTSFHNEQTDEVFRIEGRLVMVEKVPAQVCDRCGEATFSRETVEDVRHTVHDNTQPNRQVSMDVFAYPSDKLKAS